MISMVFLAHEKRTHIFFTCPPNCGSQFRNPSRHRQALEKTSLELKQIFINTAVPWLEGMKQGMFWDALRVDDSVGWFKGTTGNHCSSTGWSKNSSAGIIQFLVSSEWFIGCFPIRDFGGCQVAKWLPSIPCFGRLWITMDNLVMCFLKCWFVLWKTARKTPDLSIGFVDDDFIWQDEGCNGHH